MPGAPRVVVVWASDSRLPAAAFGRRYRVLRPAQYAEIFAARRVLRGDLFALHYRAGGPGGAGGARLGLVIAKKQARTAVLRNAIKRQARETFRHMRSRLPAADLILRLGAQVAAHDRTHRTAWRAEIRTLLERLAETLPMPEGPVAP